MFSKNNSKRHLQDDRLYECFVAAQTGDALDPPAADHLADCAACQARYTELASFVGVLRAEADAEVEALFPAEALQAQQADIARRIEHLGHAARVISFPNHPATGAAAAPSRTVAPRWLAAAAAAGLFIGVGVGSVGVSRIIFSPFSHARAAFSHAPASAPAPATAQQPAAPAPETTAQASASDAGASTDPSDQFFEELELALERPRTSELRALDELTPHVREISLNIR